MDDRNQLFGDAKATAKADTGDRKSRVLAQAIADYEANKNPQTQAVLARAYFDMGRYNEAEGLLKSLVDAGTTDLQLLSDLGFTYKNLKETEKASEVFKKLVQLEPKHALARSAEIEIWQFDPEIRPSWMRKN